MTIELKESMKNAVKEVRECLVGFSEEDKKLILKAI